MDYFYYWPDYQQDTKNQTEPHYKLHRDTDNLLAIREGDIIWCGISLETPRASKRVALGAKIIAKKSGSNDRTHPDWKYGPHYFVAERVGTEFYEVDTQVDFEDLLRRLSFPVRADHVGGSLQGKNGFRQLTEADAKAFREFAARLASHPVIVAKGKGIR